VKFTSKSRVAFYSVLVGVFLTGIKVIVGLLTGSLGILSEALHSLLDLGAALITFFAVRMSIQPPDRSHPYGHGKIENLSALAEALLLLVTCVWIIYEAVERLLGKTVRVEASVWAFTVMGISVVMDILISRLLYRAARKYSSQALEADGLHYASDILSSSVVILGLVGVRLGIPALDPVAALGVAVLVTIASIRLGKTAVEELLDRAPKGIPEKIAGRLEAIPDVKKVERIRIRRSGPLTFVDLVVSAGRLMSLDESHDLAERIEAAVRGILPESDILVHFHPSSDGESLHEAVRAVARSRCPRIRDIHNIQIYKDETSGRYFLSMHVRLDPSLSLEEAHGMISTLERDIRREMDQIDTVVTHIETTESVDGGTKEEMSREMLQSLRRAFAGDERIGEIHEVFLHRRTQGTLVSCHVTARRKLALEEAHQVATSIEEEVKKLLPDAAEVVVHAEPPDRE
jgi:cation diffusion facilitator family transporter